MNKNISKKLKPVIDPELKNLEQGLESIIESLSILADYFWADGVKKGYFKEDSE